MNTIGVRDAKARFSRLLRDVRNGQEWTITERGTPVARLVPVGDEHLSLAQRLRGLEERGVLERLSHGVRPVPPPLPLEPGLAQRWLQEGRERDRS